MWLFCRRRQKPQKPPIPRSDPEAELRAFRNKLERSLVESSLNNDKQFLPVTEIDNLVNPRTIRSVLPNKASSEIVDFICHHGKSFFLILVVGNAASPQDLLSIMQSCRDHNMTDEQLPVDRIACVGGKSPCDPRQMHHEAWNVFHDDIWTYICRPFYREQGTFTAPVFRKDEFIYDLKEGCVLPVIRKGQERDGHFSTVYEAYIHPAHHEEGRRSKQPLHVALKKLKPLSSEPGYNVQTAWNHEASALEEINKLQHHNLIRPIAAIRCGSEHYIMFEWADGGSLRELWESQGSEPKDLDADRVMVVIEELRGLVGALSTLHGTNTRTKTANVVRRAANLAGMAASERLAVPANPARRRHEEAKDSEHNTPSVSSLKSPKKTPEIRVRFAEPSDDGLSFRSEDPNRSYVSEESDASSDEHWRHGDLKPDNILQFTMSTKDSSRWLGTLKIADLGLAKQHIFATARRNDMTDQKYTTSHYEAPEAVANVHLPRSRRFDIWSMGCVILEFVIVILYGNKGLDTFYDQQKIRENLNMDTLYFSVDRNVARVSAIVRHWIAQILKDAECDRPSALGDLVRLVRDRLLIVELPSENMTAREVARCRADAAELKEKLDDIWRKARDSEFQGGNYLCLTTHRKGVPLPQPLQGIKTKKGSTTTGRLGDDLPKSQRNLV
ncbi:kinase-like domain-containing protein [Triangularia verruculosa]|uniref:Kinase-like domain-containing protein n=1 Tax=Triangularia verruculosa TaxID=2587418 RepID=A0AAN6XSY0_9PEZI|nr:kinase-like domain-containing protein [Triangularia verruculosa]